MRKTIVFTVWALVIGFADLNARAAEPAQDPVLVRGEHIARTVCSACHVVAADQEFIPLLRPPAPSFKDIANRPDTTAKSVRHFVTSTHWDMNSLPLQMPSPMLSDTEASAVARYMMTLRAR